MKFLRTRTADPAADAPDEEPVDTVEVEAGTRAHTPAKGRPTPKRRDAEARRRGPVAPPPTTQREAYKRSRGNKEDRRKASAERRERMAAGDERYLLARDKGPVKRYARDLVDSRRHFLGLLMPLALVMVVVMLSPVTAIQLYVTPAVMAIIVVMAVEGFIVGRRVNRLARAKFPDHLEKPLALGWYATMRASQIRRLRVPKPLVKPGDAV